ncbi:hypothetical protein EB796_006855 [Bugula neritina]|uniref:Uncharacterized protein n=1 Tax=Bugula neritina TaxID=10212 RepID=A0A7J7K874_BUGNE|nr:hypothetical protein EB796_006855 [Bugula neritina]
MADSSLSAQVKFVSKENNNVQNDLTDESVQQEDRKKFLTMKYGQKEIKLIQRRLKVEFWMDEELNKLYDIDTSSGMMYPCDVDLDEVIDLETNIEKRQYLEDSLMDCKKPQILVKEFIEELLTKLKTLSE